jgi:RNA polymerase sigma factor (sigma-70 family)
LPETKISQKERISCEYGLSLIESSFTARYHFSRPNHVRCGICLNKDIPAMSRVARSVLRADFDFAHCLAQARTGDRNAIAQLVHEFAPYLRATLLTQFRRDRGPRDSDIDIILTAVARAYEMFHECHGTTEAEVRFWLRRILCNYSAKNGREKQRRPWPLDEQPEPVDPRTESRAKAERERDEAVAEALAELREDEQLLVTWHYIDRRRWWEISEGLGRSVDSVQKAGVRALRKFTRRLRIIAPQLFSKEFARM